MSIHYMFQVVYYEMKTQWRSWIFRFFTLFSLVGIMICHVYWQGQGNCMNWKMVALPCSMPLVNAYLFSVVQSLFLIVIMAGIPRRMERLGAFETIYARPFHNVTFYWGTIIGNFLLFLLLNVVVILAAVFVVNLTSLAPVGWKYYIFYLLTLNIPAWVFVAGLTLWISSVARSRVMAIVLSVIWWIACIFWLPYWQHGTFDYLASGVPNLFSEVIGHLNFPLYVLHRCAYLLVGAGLLVYSVNRMKRLPNETEMRKTCLSGGILLVVCGVVCGGLLEYSYYRDRKIRADYYASFEHNWKEVTCRVRNHSIELEQSGETLTMRSDMTVYNPGKESLAQIVLFLNPGLRVTKLGSGEDDLAYRRDEQAILIDRSLGVGDSLRLHVEYSGRIDDRFCDLHLTDEVYEDPFYQDRFFATGRQGAFVNEELLVLSPACTWYPVAIPPVNPLMPAATGRDFTHFRLLVKHSAQKVIISQGKAVEREYGITFTCRNSLNGISLFGANCQQNLFPIDEKFSFQLNSNTLGKQLAKNFSRISRAAFITFWREPQSLDLYEVKEYRNKSWVEPEVLYLYLLEVPVSFRLDSHMGKSETGLVEPGMIFLRERGFDMDLVWTMTKGKIKNRDDFQSVVTSLFGEIFSSWRRAKDSHPLLGLFKRKVKEVIGDEFEADYCGSSLWQVQRVWVYSSEYPFIGKVFENLSFGNFKQARGIANLLFFAGMKKKYDDLSGHSIVDILNENKEAAFEEKLVDLWTRLTLKIPSGELEQSLDSLFRCCSGEIDYDSLVQVWSTRWNTNISAVMQDWVTTRHEQYFKIKDAVLYYDSDTRRTKAIGKIMNVGKDGGVVSIEYGSFMNTRRSVCYVRPGEVKAFTLVTDETVSSINTGLSANRPPILDFQERKIGSLIDSLGIEWYSIPLSEFVKEENPNERIVDDSDPEFELVNGNLTWIQRWLQDEPDYRMIQGGETNRWEPVIDIEAYGDSIRGYWCISGGMGKSTATWRLNIPEAGRYQVMGKVYRATCIPITISLPGVVYYYTISFGDQKKEVEVNLDAELPDSYEKSCWASLGEYDFPAGEVSVTLSDKEIHKRKEVAIVADAVKFIKIE